MTEPPILTVELVARIERLTAEGVVADTPTVAEFGATMAGKAVGGRPRNWVLGFGRPDLPRLRDILDFYAEDGLRPQFALSPLGLTADVAAALHAAGFAQQEFDQAILYGVPLSTPPAPPDHVAIDPVTAASAEHFVTTTADGFGWAPEWRAAAMAGLRSELATTDRPRFLARYDGRPAGVAACTIRPDGVAALGSGAVIPEYRRRGIHLALVKHRLHLAHRHGCELILGGAAYGSASFRNQQRAGLRLAYIESVWGPVDP